MQNELKNEIKRLSARIFLKKSNELEKLKKYRKKFELRTGLNAGKPANTHRQPLHTHFDPKHCMRNANAISKAIWHKILDFKYEPEPAILFEIAKPDGSKRQIMSFGIPDAALANVVLRRTRSRNLKKLSPYSYAYHPEKMCLMLSFHYATIRMRKNFSQFRLILKNTLTTFQLVI